MLKIKGRSFHITMEDWLRDGLLRFATGGVLSQTPIWPLSFIHSEAVSHNSYYNMKRNMIRFFPEEAMFTTWVLPSAIKSYRQKDQD